MLGHAPRDRLVAGIPGEKLAVAHVGLGVGQPVDVVGMPFNRRKPGGDKSFGQALRRLGKAGGDDEASEALAEHRPGFAPEGETEVLGVGGYGILAETGNEGGLHGGRPDGGNGLRLDGMGAAGASLVEQDHAVVVERGVEPRTDRRHSGAAESRPSLKIDEPRQFLVAVPHVFACEELDLLRDCRRFVPCKTGQGPEAIERNPKRVLDHCVPRQAERRVVHGPSLIRPPVNIASFRLKTDGLNGKRFRGNTAKRVDVTTLEHQDR